MNVHPGASLELLQEKNEDTIGTHLFTHLFIGYS